MLNWTSILVRVAGTLNPLSAALVQLQSELDSTALQERVRRLEDPLFAIDADLPAVGRIIYDAVRATGNASFAIPDVTYLKYSRCFALLEQRGHLKSAHRIGNRVPLNTRVSDPQFLLYLCALFEDQTKMDLLLAKADAARFGSILDGGAIAKELQLPLNVVRAVFEVYERKGLGFLSKEIGRVTYHARV